MPQDRLLFNGKRLLFDEICCGRILHEAVSRMDDTNGAPSFMRYGKADVLIRGFDGSPDTSLLLLCESMKRPLQNFIKNGKHTIRHAFRC